MGNQDDCEAVDLTDRLPALLTILDAVLHGQMQRIEEDAGGNLKAEAVLALVDRFLSSSQVKSGDIIQIM